MSNKRLFLSIPLSKIRPESGVSLKEEIILSDNEEELEVDPEYEQLQQQIEIEERAEKCYFEMKDYIREHDLTLGEKMVIDDIINLTYPNLKRLY